MADILREVKRMGIGIREYWDFGASASKAEAMAALARTAEEKKRYKEMLMLCREQQELIDEEPRAQYKILTMPLKNFWNGHGVRIDVLAPSSAHYQYYINFLSLKDEEDRRVYAKKHPESGDDNIVCSGLLLTFGEFRCILGADLTNKAWLQILRPQRLFDLPCHALKISHHGSLEGNFPDEREPLWGHIKKHDEDLVAVISGGYRTALPHERTLQSLEAAGIRVVCELKRAKV